MFGSNKKNGIIDGYSKKQLKNIIQPEKKISLDFMKIQLANGIILFGMAEKLQYKVIN